MAGKTKKKPKVCNSYTSFEYIDAECPYCGESSDYYGRWCEGDSLTCTHCKRGFVLGEES